MQRIEEEVIDEGRLSPEQVFKMATAYESLVHAMTAANNAMIAEMTATLNNEQVDIMNKWSQCQIDLNANAAQQIERIVATIN